jgi:hypothetical protein
MKHSNNKYNHSATIRGQRFDWLSFACPNRLFTKKFLILFGMEDILYN